MQREPDSLGVLAILDGHTKGRRSSLEVQLTNAELVERARPVERLGDAGRFEQVLIVPDGVGDPHHLLGQPGGHLQVRGCS